MPEPTYPLPAVLQVIGISESTATNWTRRGYQDAELAPAGRGRTRRVTVSDIVRLSIMKACADLGVAPPRSAGWASVALHRMATDSQFRTLHILLYPGEERILVDDELLVDDKLQLPAGPTVKLSIDVRQIVSSTRAALLQLQGADDTP